MSATILFAEANRDVNANAVAGRLIPTDAQSLAHKKQHVVPVSKWVDR